MSQLSIYIRTIKTKYPLWSLISFLICYRVAEAFIFRYWNGLLYRLGLYGKFHPYLSGCGQRLLILAVILVLMFILGQMNVFTRERRKLPGALIPGLYMLLMSLLTVILNLAGAKDFQNLNTIVYSTIYFILVAFTEELVYRGTSSDMLLKTLLFRCDSFGKDFCGNDERKAIWAATIFSGLIFGIAHISNMSYADISGVLVQMLGAFLMGMVLVAVYYRTANIYAVIILHATNDIAAALPVTILRSGRTVSDVISGYGMKDVLLLIPYIVVLFIILRPSKLDSIWDHWIREQKDNLKKNR